MLTGSGGYLQPDYLKPLPTTLDAKNSPLALLAKTCSNIGKDESAKSIIPPIEKADKGREASKSTSPSNRTSPSSDKDARVKLSPERLNSDRFKMDLKDIHSPSRHSDVLSPRKDLSPKHQSHHHRDGGSTPKSPGLIGQKLDLKSSSDSKISLNCGSLSLEINHKETNVTSASGNVTSSPTSSVHHSVASYSHPLASSKLGGAPLPSHAGLLSAYYPHLGLPGYPGLSAAAALHPALSAEAALLAAQRQKDSSPHVAVSYNPVKTASGATTLVPVCSDPYCVSCKLAMQNAQLATPPCAAGCTQCTRDKSLPGLHTPPTSLPGYPGSLGLSGLHSLSSLYGHNHHSSSLPSHSSSLPYVCSWVSGTSYCGEKFATSEELMSHLRTHTTSLEQSALHSGLSAYNPLALAGLGSIYPHLAGGAGSISPNTLSRHYPRSLSPTQLLAASRYHPYLKPPSLGGLPTSLPSSALHPSSLASAYPSLYPSLSARYGSALVP